MREAYVKRVQKHTHNQLKFHQKNTFLFMLHVFPPTNHLRGFFSSAEEVALVQELRPGASHLEIAAAGASYS